MKKMLVFTMMMAFMISAGAAAAANYDYSDAAGYSLANHSNPSWQRLGTAWNAEAQPSAGVIWSDGSDDGVFWSINGGAFGRAEITAGDEVTFKFVMYKEMWGRHSYDYLKVWVDWDRDRNFADDGVFYQNQWWFQSDSGDAGQTPTTPYAYGDGLAQIYKTFYYTITMNADPGEYWLRARVVCNADINSNPGSFTPTGQYWQGEVEDWKFKVNPVPEPATLLLFGLGLLGLAGIGRKLKK
jgi:hypothetical protein